MQLLCVERWLVNHGKMYIFGRTTIHCIQGRECAALTISSLILLCSKSIKRPFYFLQLRSTTTLGQSPPTAWSSL